MVNVPFEKGIRLMEMAACCKKRPRVLGEFMKALPFQVIDLDRPRARLPVQHLDTFE